MTLGARVGIQEPWVSMPLKHVFAVYNGSTPSSSEPSYWDGDIHWATPEDVGSLEGKTLFDTKRKITKDGYQNSGTHLVPINSIILTTRAPVGNLALAGVPLCTNQGCKTLVPRSKNIEESYFYYQLCARKDNLIMLSTGTTFLELSSSALASLELWIPPLSTQRAIATYLDRETAKIDAMIAVKQRLLDLLDEKRRALITQAVTRGLVSSAEMRDSGVAWLGDIPKHWEVRWSKSLFHERDDRTLTGEEVLLSLRMERGLVPHDEVSEKPIRPEDLLGYKKVAAHEIVLNRMRAASGLVAVSSQDGLVSPDYAVFQVMTDANPYYYGYLFKTDLMQAVFRSESTGLGTGSSGFLRLYSDNFLSLWFPCPPIEEQSIIVQYIDRIISTFNDLYKTAEQSIFLLHERRAALIAAAVTGQITLEDYDAT